MAPSRKMSVKQKNALLHHRFSAKRIPGSVKMPQGTFRESA